MKNFILMAWVLLAASAADAADERLYRTTFEVQSRFETLATIYIEEMQRSAKTSVLRIHTDRGGFDYISDLHLMVGVCGVAKSRGRAYVQARQVEHQPFTFELSFPESGPDPAQSPATAMAPDIFPVALCP